MEDIQLSLFGRTCQEHSAPTEAGTSGLSSKKCAASGARKLPLCLCLKVDGPKPDASTMIWADGQLPIAWSMLNTGERPSEENESHLSQILEATAPPRFSLSSRACRGILNRAERRGKALPEALKAALEEQISAHSKTGEDVPGCKGPLIRDNMSATLGCNNDQTVFCLQGNTVDRESKQNGAGVMQDVAYTLDAADRHAIVLNDQGGSIMSVTEDVTSTLRAQEHGHQPIVYDARGNGDGATVPTLTGDHQNRVTDYTALCIGNGQANQSISETAGTLNTMHDQQAVFVNSSGCGVATALDSNYYRGQGQRGGKEREFVAYLPTLAHTLRAKANCDFREDSETYIAAVDCRNGTENPDANGTLQAKGNGGTSLNLNNVCRSGNVVRRLTPLECERLQGYPDGWTDIGDWTDTKGKLHKAADSPRYKALGNSIAVGYANRQSGFWCWLLKRISGQFTRTATLGSLFDGIGGFPLAWEAVNGRGSARWASEIEEFPIAVTKYHFPEEE